MLCFDFDSGQAEPRWGAVNDGVMGGLSEGVAKIEDGVMHFSGRLSLANNGGFSSVRTLDYRADLEGAEGIRLRVLGDGRTYQLRIGTNAKFRGSRIAYKADFKTQKGKWCEVEIPFDSLAPSWRGMRLKGPDFDLKQVSQVGLLIGDKKAGPFSLKVDWIKSY